MTYQEREISKNQLKKILQTLDLDEGIRIENKSNMIFLNRSAKRYCINISTQDNEEFFYRDNVKNVLDFLNEKIEESAAIFSY
ncbi:MAG TPA: hypothetical protein VK431_02490 [Nitrosopumilaceae archaeon]|nr:hypothetical protein [Nitrosopumilaceae archaeon]